MINCLPEKTFVMPEWAKYIGYTDTDFIYFFETLQEATDFARLNECSVRKISTGQEIINTFYNERS